MILSYQLALNITANDVNAGVSLPKTEKLYSTHLGVCHCLMTNFTVPSELSNCIFVGSVI